PEERPVLGRADGRGIHGRSARALPVDGRPGDGGTDRVRRRAAGRDVGRRLPDGNRARRGGPGAPPDGHLLARAERGSAGGGVPPRAAPGMRGRRRGWAAAAAAMLVLAPAGPAAAQLPGLLAEEGDGIARFTLPL